MKCNLVKKVVKKMVKGEEKTFTNYYLIFENGKSVSIAPRYIPTESIKDSQILKNVERSNTENALMLNLFSDILKNEEK